MYTFAFVWVNLHRSLSGLLPGYWRKLQLEVSVRTGFYRYPTLLFWNWWEMDSYKCTFWNHMLHVQIAYLLETKTQRDFLCATRDRKWLGAQNPASHNEQAGLRTGHNEQSFGIPTCLLTACRGWGPCPRSTSHPYGVKEMECTRNLGLKHGWIHRNARNLHALASHHQKWMDLGKPQFLHGWLIQQSSYLQLQRYEPITQNSPTSHVLVDDYGKKLWTL